jgi:DNA-binding response OmpR family regulator
MSVLSAFRQLFTQTAKREGTAAEEEVSFAEVIDSGDFKLDVRRRVATLGQQRLQLTSAEFDVLVFLSGHPQRLVTANTMLATSWSANRPRQTEFLKVLLSLRAKLEAAEPGQHYLRTEPWVLYRFNPSSAVRA